MPIKGKVPQANRPGNVLKKNSNEIKKDSVKMPSTARSVSSTQRPLKSNDPSAPKKKATTATTATAAKNTTIGPKKFQPVRKNLTGIQGNGTPKLSSSGESTQKPSTVFLLKPKGNKFTDCKSSSNTSTGSKLKLSCEAMSAPSEATSAPKYLRRQSTCDEMQLRVSENKKLQAFEVVQDKLRDIQASFMKKCESLPCSVAKTRGPFKFISMVKNDKCKLIINEEDLIGIPTNIPIESVSDLKQTVKEIFASNLDVLQNYSADIKKPETETDWRKFFESMRDKLEHHQDGKINALLQKFDELCSKPSDAEAELRHMLGKLQEAESRMNKFKVEKQKETSALIAKHEAELAQQTQSHKEIIAKIKRQAILSSSVQATLSAKQEKIESKDIKIKQLTKEIDHLKNCIKEFKSNKQKVQDKEILLQQQILQLKQELRQSKMEIRQLQAKQARDEKTSTSEEGEIFALTQKLADTEIDLKYCQELYAESAQLINALVSAEAKAHMELETVTIQSVEKHLIVPSIATEKHRTTSLEEKLKAEGFTMGHGFKIIKVNMKKNEILQVNLEQKLASLEIETIQYLNGKDEINILFNTESD